MTETELRRIRVLDWLLDYQSEQPGTMAEINDLAGNEEDLPQTEQDLWRDVLWSLSDDGLIKLAPSLGFNWGLLLTGRGRQEAEARRAKRQNAGARRAYAREALLAWLYEQPDHKATETADFATSPYGYFEGFPLEPADIQEAASYLLRRKLVDGLLAPYGLVAVELTIDGVDVIDHYGGSVSEYVRRSDGVRANNTVNIGTVSSSNFAIGNRDVAQNVRAGLSGEDLGTLLQAIIEAIPALGLSSDDEVNLTDSVRMAGSELAKSEPDVGWARTLLARVGGILGKSVETALGPVLGAYLRVLAKEHGIDLGAPQ